MHHHVQVVVCSRALQNDPHCQESEPALLVRVEGLVQRLPSISELFEPGQLVRLKLRHAPCAYGLFQRGPEFLLFGCQLQRSLDDRNAGIGQRIPVR